jgi:hypothetical protein
MISPMTGTATVELLLLALPVMGDTPDMKEYEMIIKSSKLHKQHRYESCTLCGQEFTIGTWTKRINNRHDECPPTQEGEQQ